MFRDCFICNNWSFAAKMCLFGQQVPEDQRSPECCDEFIMRDHTLVDVFRLIHKYHEHLGANTFASFNRQDANNICLALHAEVDELLESYDWKPWRPAGYKDVDQANMMVEIVDILFFLGSFAETFGITGSDLTYTFFKKLSENYNRISEGYNVTGTTCVEKP